MNNLLCFNLREILINHRLKLCRSAVYDLPLSTSYFCFCNYLCQQTFQSLTKVIIDNCLVIITFYWNRQVFKLDQQYLSNIRSKVVGGYQRGHIRSCKSKKDKQTKFDTFLVPLFVLYMIRIYFRVQLLQFSW